MTQPKITKTHRWDPDQFAEVEEVARRTGRPVQHVLDDAISIGLKKLTGRLDNWGRDMQRWEIWESYVGSQTCEEFWSISQQGGATSYREAAQRYTLDLPNIYRDDWRQMDHDKFPDLDSIAHALEECLEERLGTQ